MESLAEIEKWTGTRPLCLLVFTTASCGVCDALRPRIEVVARTYAMETRYIDVEESPSVAGQFEIFAVPVYVMFVNGREAVRFARHFSVDELEATADRYSTLLELQ